MSIYPRESITSSSKWFVPACLLISGIWHSARKVIFCIFLSVISLFHLQRKGKKRSNYKEISLHILYPLLCLADNQTSKALKDFCISLLPSVPGRQVVPLNTVYILRGFQSRHILEINEELKALECLKFFTLRSHSLSQALRIIVVAIEFLKEELYWKASRLFLLVLKAWFTAVLMQYLSWIFILQHKSSNIKVYQYIPGVLWACIFIILYIFL